MTGIRKASYTVKAGTLGEAKDGVIWSGGDENPIGQIDPETLLEALFQVRDAHRKWWFGVGAKQKLEQIKAINSPTNWNQLNQDFQVLCGTRLMSVAALRRLGDATACRSAQRVYEHSLERFLNRFGPLVESDCTDDFADAMSDIMLWALRAQGVQLEDIFDPDTPRGSGVLARNAAAVKRIQAAIQSVAPRLDGTYEAPSLHAGLLYAVEQAHVRGIRFYQCENPDCLRMFIPNYSNTKYCDPPGSSRCKQHAYNLRKRAKHS